ncbi:UvrD-helicase domain-containing protein [Pedobacter montanisoli]|uniref:DNA 3'-5' helicase n=1 Tax=Pedobacter montanisoli TaxID=2923277 RepID=A0ABS9ZTQ6_9SPHI|nr:UvrD-helicase domain-containing protein [Pedobacter montanisoli]MCJ0741985.1 UvrD-helicase domain-containing protein [Pedobacter montanisoli]
MPKPLKILQASAGSGKTFSLAAHYLTLLFSNENKYREILAVTFTNKATEEMKTRILSELKDLAQGNKKAEAYQNIILKAHPHFNAETLKLQADLIYRRILHDYSRFAVSTIDGFVQKVIRGFAFELGLNADYNLEMNYDKVKDELVAKLDKNLDHNKNLLQWIIDLALERISENKSWNYKDELSRLIGEIFKESFEVFEEALHQTGLENVDELFKQYVLITKKQLTDYENDLTALGEEGFKLFEKHNITVDQLKGKSRNPLLKIQLLANQNFEKVADIFKMEDDPDNWFQKGVDLPGFYQEFNALIKRLRAYHESNLPAYTLAAAFNKNLYYMRIMQEVALLLSEYRNENDNLLISDAQKLITGITDDAGENPSFIWEKVGSKYQNFLFDEFQDTSGSQWKSFRSLLKNAMAAPSEKMIDNLIVGDTKQSIYRWRGGDWNILYQQAKSDVGFEQVLEDSLEENYRSTSNIIKFNNYLYQSIPLLLQTQLNNLLAENATLEQWWQQMGFSQIITSIYNGASQNLASSTKSGGVIKVKRFGKEEESGRYTETVFRDQVLTDVIIEIKDLIANKKYQAKDIAILVRSNAEAELCVNRLMEEGIPVLSGDALLIASNSAIQLIINTLKILVGLNEQTALYKANAISLYHYIQQKEVNVSQYFDLKTKDLSQLADVLPQSLCENWQTWLQLPLSELIENLIESYGIGQSDVHLPYLLAFRDLAGQATRLGEKGIVSFLKWWDEDGCKKSLPSPEKAEAVQIITIHKSKGLAFRAVFIPFCLWSLKTKSDSIFWVPAHETAYHQLGGMPLRFSDALANSKVAKSYFEEVLYSGMDSLNMLYVATTRAIDYMYLGVMDKTDRSKITVIGDILAKSLTDLDLSFDETNEYMIDEYVSTVGTDEEKQLISLAQYPTTERLSELYVPPQEKHLKHILNIEKSGRKGSILHDILANANTETGVENYLWKLLIDGDITSDEKDKLKTDVLEVLNHPELKDLFAGSSAHIIEQNIIDVNGKLHRPDRIIIKADQVIILDYKFTLAKSDLHIQQLQTYKELLKQMGYEHIRSYLFYAVTQELVEV